ncbi:MAG: hypothetical protein GXY20_07875 [Clostridiales bacterium]|nr:hypothetical protein [Clostridiales bacterium]
MNLWEYPRPVYSINQFCQPHCSELAGQSFFFVMDSGYDCRLDITGADTCMWSIAGQEPQEATYECLKGDDTTYLLDYDVRETLGTNNRVNHLYIIDMEQSLVTRLVCTIGCNPKFPNLVKSEVDFGAIKVEGKDLPFKRHCFTTDLLGTRVEWHWSTTMWTRHDYFSTAYYRITWPEDSSAAKNIGEPFLSLPSTDERAFYVKIKENMYLFCLTEELTERLLQGKTLFCSNNMAFLQNYDRMYHVGRTFGTINSNGNLLPCRTLFGAFGNPVSLSPEFLNAENPYTV